MRLISEPRSVRISRRYFGTQPQEKPEVSAREQAGDGLDRWFPLTFTTTGFHHRDIRFEPVPSPDESLNPKQ